MPRYFYIAKSLQGEKQEGTLSAESEFQLARTLRERGLVLISAREKTKVKRPARIRIPFFRKVSLVEKMMFTRNLKIMISAGVPLPKALETLAQQVRSERFKEVLLGTKEMITKGRSFSESLSKYPDIFPELFSSMVEVGEEGGRLEEVLEILTRQMEREYELKSKIKGAMMYPAVVILAMLGIGALMLIMVVPKISTTFEELDIELPPTTRFVIWLGNNLVAKWYLLLLAILFGIFLFRQGTKTKIGKKFIDALTLKIPIISPILKSTNSAYTTRILSSLIASGVPIARSLEILSGTLGNVYYKEAIAKASKEVRKGVKLSDVLLEYQEIFPLLVIQMIAVGEETGKTSEILGKLADFFEERVTNATKNLASIIEPVIMLLIGGAVGFFAVSMIQPMYSMLGAMK